MKRYIGCKMVKAEPCIRVIKRGRDGYTPVVELVSPTVTIPIDAEATYGYKVRYADGYESYSPKSVFEASYIECDEECNINPKSLIAEEERFITDGALGIGVKLACIKAKLINGDVVFQCKAVMWDELDDETLYEQVRDKVLEEIKCRCRFAEVTAKNGLDSVARKGS